MIYADILNASIEFGADYGAMVRVAQCESHMNPLAVNPRSGDAGLFQWDRRYWPINAAALGYGPNDIWSPVAQSRVTAMVVAREGWWRWSCKP